MKPLTVLSSPDARTALVAVAAAAGAIVYLGLAVASFLRVHSAFDGAAFATGWSMVLGASAAAIAGHAWGQAKADAIPSAPDPVPTVPPTSGGGS